MTNDYNQNSYNSQMKKDLFLIIIMIWINQLVNSKTIRHGFYYYSNNTWKEFTLCVQFCCKAEV